VKYNVRWRLICQRRTCDAVCHLNFHQLL